MYRWEDFYQEIKRQKRLFITAQILALLATLASIPTPLLMPLLVDEVLLEKRGWLVEKIDTLFHTNEAWFYVLVVLILTLLLRSFYTFLSILQAKMFQTISKEITYKVRQRVLNHLKSVAMEEYELLGSGKVASRLITDINTIDNFLSASVSKFIISLLTLIGVSVVLLLIHWQLALFILFLNPIVVVFSTKLARNVALLKKRENQAIEVFQNSLIETLEVFEQIRAANKEDSFFRKLLLRLKEVKSRSIEFSWKSDGAVRLSFLLFLAGFELFRAAGIIAVAYSSLSIGLMMAIFGYLWFMMTPIQELINIIHTKRSADIALKRVNELLALKKEPQFPHKKDPFIHQGGVEILLENVSFGYGEELVLKDISLRIPANQISAIVGASGSGKTTLSRLLVGFYVPKKGEISYNGVAIEEIGLDVVRTHVSLVLQTPLLFNNTVRFNVTLGKEIEEEKIIEALRKVELLEIVTKMPQGVDSIVGKGGVKLSGGERQRIALARMILQEPHVVILDESTSAIDMETEKRIFDNLRQFFHSRTTIIIAHRPSTIEEANKLFFIEDGRVKKETSFAEYKKNGVCYENGLGRL